MFIIYQYKFLVILYINILLEVKPIFTKQMNFCAGKIFLRLSLINSLEDIHTV